MIQLILVFLATSVSARDWQFSNNVTDHDVFPGAHCAASTGKASIKIGRRTRDLPQGLARLEVIASQASGNEFQQPRVQIVLQASDRIPAQALTLTTAEGLVFDRVLGEEAQERAVFVGKLDEREKLIADIRRLATLQVGMKDANRNLGTLNFSLRGSSRAVARQFNDCQLNFATHQPID